MSLSVVDQLNTNIFETDYIDYDVDPHEVRILKQGMHVMKHGFVDAAHGYQSGNNSEITNGLLRAGRYEESIEEEVRDRYEKDYPGITAAMRETHKQIKANYEHFIGGLKK